MQNNVEDLFVWSMFANCIFSYAVPKIERIVEAAHFANMTASVVVSKTSTSLVTRGEFEYLRLPGRGSPKIMREEHVPDLLAV
jgi:bifunctional ADP-heptose synthase (sugar kinase/adenylyltransferase)